MSKIDIELKRICNDTWENITDINLYELIKELSYGRYYTQVKGLRIHEYDLLKNVDFKTSLKVEILNTCNDWEDLIIYIKELMKVELINQIKMISEYIDDLIENPQSIEFNGHYL